MSFGGSGFSTGTKDAFAAPGVTMGRGSFGEPGVAGVPGAEGGIDGVTTGRGGSFGAAGGMPAGAYTRSHFSST